MEAEYWALSEAARETV
jgi:hypothetical protein